ncbi:snake venom metalloproteinase fibrolase-like [Saccoglossus kowalevskii]
MNHEDNMNQKQVSSPPHIIHKKSTSNPLHNLHANGLLTRSKRVRRDIHSETKYIELALVCDLLLYSTLQDLYGVDAVMSSLLQIVNTVDLYFQELNIRLSLSYVEMWTETDQITPSSYLVSSLQSFKDYVSINMADIHKDNTQLLRRTFQEGEMGVSYFNRLCSANHSVGVSQVTETTLDKAAAILTYQIANNIGIRDDGYHTSSLSTCTCSSESCLMDGANL